jgi:hypothetical protein
MKRFFSLVGYSIMANGSLAPYISLILSGVLIEYVSIYQDGILNVNGSLRVAGLPKRYSSFVEDG